MPYEPLWPNWDIEPPVGMAPRTLFEFVGRYITIWHELKSLQGQAWASASGGGGSSAVRFEHLAADMATLTLWEARCLQDLRDLWPLIVEALMALSGGGVPPVIPPAYDFVTWVNDLVANATPDAKELAEKVLRAFDNLAGAS